MRYQVLGPLRATRDGDDVTLGGPQQRLVLAMLLGAEGHPISTGRLIEGIWGEEEPPTAKKTLQGYVHHLRQHIGDSLTTEGSGYALSTTGNVDASDFEQLHREAAECLETAPDRACELLQEALGLWNGAPYSDLADFASLAPEIARLEDLRITALGDRVDADLSLGRHAALIGELEALTQEYPHREGFRSQHMTALFRAGRQVEALRSFERFRRMLADEMGLEPSAALRELENRILSDDDELRAVPILGSSDPVAVRGYELRDVIASTPSGRTYRAYQRSIGRQVCVKMLGSDVADDPEFIATFLSDTKRVAALEHPHVGEVFDTWRQPGSAYQISRWFERGSLADVLADGIPTAPVALGILDDVADALSHAHRAGVIHGHVSASNVLLDSGGHAYVSDFVVGRMPGRSAQDDRLALAILARTLLTAPSGETPVGVDKVLQIALGDDGYRQPEHLTRALRRAMGVDVAPSADTTRSELRNPYKGLQAFDELDANDFYGRAALTDRLLKLVNANRLVAVVGPSGSGKSSLVRAGLLPRLQRSSIGPIRLVARMYPSTFPFEELEDALLQIGVSQEAAFADLVADERGLARVLKRILPERSELVLMIDQFEELFSTVRDEDVRTLFLDSLAAAVADPHVPLRIVLTLRADFFDKPLEHARFGELVQAALMPVSVPDVEQLGEAIRQPAEALGVSFEDGLIDAIVDDVGGQPGALPLLQYVLTDLFERRDTDSITFAEYHRTGGVLGALGARAEGLFQGLAPTARDALRQALLRMVSIDDNVDDLRRRVLRSELRSGEVDTRALDDALSVFGAHRLLTFDLDPATSAPTVEVAHEALFREWPRLRGWIEELADDLIMRRRLASAIAEWRASGEEESYLPSGGRRAQFDGWSATTSLTLSSDERDFIAAASAREQKVAVLSARRRRVGAVGLGITAAVFAVLAGFALVQRGNANDAAEEALVSAAEARKSAARADANAAAAEANTEAASVVAFRAETARLRAEAAVQADSNPVLGLLLAATAFTRDSGPESLGALQQALTRAGGLTAQFGDGALQVLWSGDRIVSLRPDGVSVYDATTLDETMRFDLPVSTRPADFPDFLPAEVDGGLTAFAIDPQGLQVAVAIEPNGVALIDLRSGAVTESTTSQAVSAIAFSPDGAVVAVGDVSGTVELRKVEGFALLHRIEPVDDSNSYSDFKQFEFWQGSLPAYEDHLFWVGGIAFSDDGSELAISQGPRVGIWRATDGTLAMEPVLIANQMDFPVASQNISFVADELWVQALKTLVIVDRINGVTVEGIGLFGLETEGTARGLEPTNSGRVLLLHENELIELDIDDPLAAVETEGARQAKILNTIELPVPVREGFDLSPGGDRWVVAAANSLIIGTTHGLGPLATVVPAAVAESPGLLLSIAGGDLLGITDGRRAEVWDLTGQPRLVPVPTSLRDELSGIAEGTVGPIGSHTVSVGGIEDRTGVTVCTNGGTVCELYAGRDFNGAPVRFFDAQLPSDVSPSGRLLAATSANGGVMWVIDLTTGEVEAQLPLTNGSLSIDWSPDGTRLYRSAVDGRLEAWDTSSWRKVETLGFGEKAGEAFVVRHSPDGRYVATLGADGIVALRDPTDWTVEAEVVTGSRIGNDVVFSSAPWFSNDSEYLLTTADGDARLWHIESGTQIGQPFPNSFPSVPGGEEASQLGLVTHVGDAVVRWNVEPSSWYEVACRAAGRNLTSTEWQLFGPTDTPHRATCPQHALET